MNHIASKPILVPGGTPKSKKRPLRVSIPNNSVSFWPTSLSFDQEFSTNSAGRSWADEAEASSPMLPSVDHGLDSMMSSSVPVNKTMVEKASYSPPPMWQLRKRSSLDSANGGGTLKTTKRKGSTSNKNLSSNEDKGLKLIPRVFYGTSLGLSDAGANAVRLLTRRAADGISHGFRPVTIDSLCSSGAYYLRDKSGFITGVFKPVGEEQARLPSSSMSSSDGVFKSGSVNKKNYSRYESGSSIKHGVMRGEAAARECAAYLLDQHRGGFCGVPVTTLVKAKHDEFLEQGWQVGSLQQYETHDCSSEDVGPSLLPVKGVHKIGILDIVLCNADRHQGNILLKTDVSNLDDHTLSASDGTGKLNQQRPLSSTLTPIASANSLPDKNRAMGTSSKQANTSSSWHPATALGSQASSVSMIPIDHGFCLPDINYLDETQFCWLQWPQAQEPFDKETLDYISSLDDCADARLIQDHLGRRITGEALLTLRVCTILLKQCAERGMNLYEIGRLMCRNGDDYSNPSWLETMVQRAGPIPERRSSPVCFDDNENLYEDDIAQEDMDDFVQRFVHVMETCWDSSSMDSGSDHSSVSTGTSSSTGNMD